MVKLRRRNHGGARDRFAGVRPARLSHFKVYVDAPKWRSAELRTELVAVGRVLWIPYPPPASPRR